MSAWANNLSDFPVTRDDIDIQFNHQFTGEWPAWKQDHPEFIEFETGAVGWIQNGLFHHEHEPSFICSSGIRRWYYMGKLHRLDGPAIEHPDGSQEWLRLGKTHRIDGPAKDLVGNFRAWWIYGVRHRADGPAYESYDMKTRHWIFHSCHYEDFNDWLEDNDEISDEDKTMLKLEYG